MTTTHIGTLTLGDALPGPADLGASVDASLAVAYPDLDSQVIAFDAQITALASLPPLPDFMSIQAAATATKAAIDAAIAVGLPGPPTNASAIFDLTAALTPILAARTQVQADLLVVAAQLAAYAAAGVDVYAFSGPRNTMGAELTAILGSATTQAWGMTLVTTNSATWTAMQQVFKTTP